MTSTASVTSTLLLDPDIRDWVVLPLFVIMVAAGLLRGHVGQLLAGEKTKRPLVFDRAAHTLQHVTRIRSGAAHYITTYQWYLRKQHYANMLREQAEWCEKPEPDIGGAANKDGGNAAANNSDAEDPMAAMMNNPMGMLKGNMAFMVQNMIMMQGIQHFFSGFILLKMPFPLTMGFKSMFQRGVEPMNDLESSYVSSVSWYFLVMYGLRAFFRLVIGDPSLEQREQEMLLYQMGLQNQPNPGQKQDAKTMAKQLRTEAENLQVLLQNHKSEMDGVERRLLQHKYPRKKVDTKDDFLFAPTANTASKKKKRT